ncbi:MAG: transketolase [Acidobacteriaceae bacterium]|nr:transketolase [Acidobacteriaceae bacterium]MBV9781839.1 transketolase [Acidobacteriaceae bacterium]
MQTLAATNGSSSSRDLRSLARAIRVDVIQMIHSAKSSHIGSCLSIVDILAVLYGRILRIDPASVKCPDRDRFILSKGHACAAVYAVLAELGFFPKSWLATFYKDGSPLPGHITHYGIPGVEVSTGSLGHGLPLACGMALAGKRQGRPYRVFAILSDGECDEGSTLEAMLFAGHHKLDNLVAVVDYNKIQSIGRVSEVLDLHPFADKWIACRWAVSEVDGHDIAALERAFTEASLQKDAPTCIIAHTIKGKGISFMEDKLLWHYRAPDEQELQKALEELLYC